MAVYSVQDIENFLATTLSNSRRYREIRSTLRESNFTREELKEMKEENKDLHPRTKQVFSLLCKLLVLSDVDTEDLKWRDL